MSYIWHFSGVSELYRSRHVCVFHWNSIPSHISAHLNPALTPITSLKLLWARSQTQWWDCVMCQTLSCTELDWFPQLCSSVGGTNSKVSFLTSPVIISLSSSNVTHNWSLLGFCETLSLGSPCTSLTGLHWICILCTTSKYLKNFRHSLLSLLFSVYILCLVISAGLWLRRTCVPPTLRYTRSSPELYAQVWFST